MKRRRPPPRAPEPIPRFGAELPGLAELDRFSLESLTQWRTAERTLVQLHRAQFFALEEQRQAHSAQLVEALRSAAMPGPSFEGWSRIIDWQYNLAPLSVAGSLKRTGGRFNIGGGIDIASFTPFPALYVAENYETAYRERFAQSSGIQPEGLSGIEFALRSPDSFTHIALRGQLENVLDVANGPALKPFTDVLAKFALPGAVRALYRRMNPRRPPWLVRTPRMLQQQLLDPYWRGAPMQFDLPSNSQIFGRLAVAAGIHGIRYTSSRQGGGHCLALFPQNWRSSSSFVEVIGVPPPEARLTRIDCATPVLE